MTEGEMQIQRRPATRGNTCGHGIFCAADGASIQLDINRVRRLWLGRRRVPEVQCDVSGGTQDEVI